MFDADSDASKFRLDPSKFPKSIDIFVSERVVDHIQVMSAKTGRSFSESAAFILAQGAEVQRIALWMIGINTDALLIFCCNVKLL